MSGQATHPLGARRTDPEDEEEKQHRADGGPDALDAAEEACEPASGARPPIEAAAVCVPATSSASAAPAAGTKLLWALCASCC